VRRGNVLFLIKIVNIGAPILLSFFCLNSPRHALAPLFRHYVTKKAFKALCGHSGRSEHPSSGFPTDGRAGAGIVFHLNKVFYSHHLTFQTNGVKDVVRQQNKLTPGIWLPAKTKEPVYFESGAYRMKFFCYCSKTNQTESLCSNRIYPAGHLHGGLPVSQLIGAPAQVFLGLNPKDPSLLTVMRARPFEGTMTSPEFMALQAEWQKQENGDKVYTPEKIAYIAEHNQCSQTIARKAARAALETKLKENKEFRAAIEAKFRPGMAWSNRGRVWELDHDRPISSFNCLIPAEAEAANALDNLIPKDRAANRAKNAIWNVAA
jgi:hypothetical protein